MIRLYKGIVLLIICTFFSGCMVGPDYLRPDSKIDNMSSFTRKPSDWIDPNDNTAIGPWWEGFNDPLINRLVAEALNNNYDLKSSAASLMEARAVLQQVHGTRFPQINYSASRTRSKTPSPIPLIESEVGNTYSHSLNISYLLDLFGKLKRSERAAVADLLASEYNQQALVHSIIAQVVNTRVQIAVQQRLLHIASSTVKSRQETLEVVERRYNQGLLSPVDMYLARENIASSRALQPQIKQQIVTIQHSLDVLTGKVPATSQELAPTLKPIPDLSPVPTSIPVNLLDRRPDIRAAEKQLEAATERIGYSIAQIYPDLTLSASGGYQSGNFDGLTLSENELYSFIMSLAAPVFRGGTLKAQVQAAKARTQRAAAVYAKTILNAIREVEDALVAEQMQIKRLKHLEVKFKEASGAEKLANDRYSKGVDNLLTVLETERRRIIAENEIVLAQGQLYTTRINLYLALGGDWGNLPEPKPEQLPERVKNKSRTIFDLFGAIE